MVKAVTLQDVRAFGESKDLLRLKDAQSRFNIFDAIGATHKELWHSDFLAFLLDPGENHGLGDEFVTRLLHFAVPDLVAIESWDGASVRREYRFIDILIESEQHQVSVIIENKIWSPEAPCQLACYWKKITEEHQDTAWRTRGIFLTPRGIRPLAEADRERYQAVSYTDVSEILGDILKAKAGGLDPDVALTIRHYIDMLWRSIVGNRDAEALARELYFKHRSAIKLMNPALWKGWIKSHLDYLMDEEAQVEKEDSTLEYVRFRVKAWDAAGGLKTGTGKTTSFPLLYFTFYNFEDSLALYLWVGPTTLPQLKEQLSKLGEQNVPPFCKSVKADRQYYDIYHLEFLTENDYQTRSDEELKVLIEAKWQHFTQHDLPMMCQALEKEDWFWKASGPEPQP